MESKTKMGGFGGAESDYEIEGEKSPVRFSNGNNLSFVFSTGASSGSSSSSPQRDSMMRASGRHLLFGFTIYPRYFLLESFNALW